MTLFPFTHFIIRGESMVPTLKAGEHVVSFNWAYFFDKPQTKDVVIIRRGKQKLVKRVQKNFNNKYFVLGDNTKHSTDSRRFGWVDKKDIIGKILIKLT